MKLTRTTIVTEKGKHEAYRIDASSRERGRFTFLYPISDYPNHLNRYMEIIMFMHYGGPKPAVL